MSSPGDSKKKKTIDDLPDEILEYILSLVSPYKDSESCKAVCRRWSKMINSVAQHAKCDLYRAVLNANVIWQCIVPPNLGPTTTITKRYSHAASYCDNFMYVFGGCTLRCTMFNDLWTLDLSSRKWIRPYSTGCYPSPKACATMCCYNKSLILFGGWTHPPPYPLHQIQRLFNELHFYDITSNTWSIIHSAVSPPPMAGHSATIHGNKMIVFGGLQWGGSLFLYSSSNDVWCFNFESHAWTKPEISEIKPKTRYGQSQIYLDDENLMIMGGCQGPNAILDDIWLLNMSGNVWVWKQLEVINTDWAAPHLWCHPACRVGDVVVVFSSGSTQNASHYGYGSSARSSPPPALQDPSIPPEVVARQASQGSSSNERDVNVNGQRGSLARRPAEEPRPGTSSASDDEPHSSARFRFGDPQHCSVHGTRSNGDLQMAAFRSDAVCSCAQNHRNRMKQLETLRRMEERYKFHSRPDGSDRPDSSDRPDTSDGADRPDRPDRSDGPDQSDRPDRPDRPRGRYNDPNDPIPGPSGGISINRMSMYVLDISKALTQESSVTWRPPDTNWNAPRDTVFHSLVLGKGELIIFGGVQKNSSASTIPVASYKSVSNNTHIVSAPRTIV